MGLQSATMNDIASWFRAQVPSSIDPDRLERLSREAERQAVLRSGIAKMMRSSRVNACSGDMASNLASEDYVTSRPSLVVQSIALSKRRRRALGRLLRHR
jgi:hypothetical protein